LDVFEFEVTNYIPIDHFKKDITIDSCMKPIIIFQGDAFETDFQFERIKTYLFDFFKMNSIDEVNISELKRIIIFSVSEDKEIKMRSFQTQGTINEYHLKEIGLTEVGPSLNLKVRKIALANEDLYKKALKQPKETKIKNKNNIEHVEIEGKKGRVWMSKQNINAMALKKIQEKFREKKI